MLRFNLTALFKAKGIDKPTQFLQKQFGFSGNTAVAIKNGRSHNLNLNTIEKLCEHFNCTPNDLIEWVPDEKQKAITNHPLAALQHKNYAEEVMRSLNELPFSKLQQLNDIINEMKK